MKHQGLMQRIRDKVTGLTRDDVLKSVGLQLLPKKGQPSGLLSRARMPLFVAFGTGIVIGAGTALLFAPESGKEARAALAQWFKTAFSGLINAPRKGTTNANADLEVEATPA